MGEGIKHVDGDDRGKVMLYALSTCIWCGKTKKLLSDLNVEYTILDVDLLDEEEQQKILKEIRKYNPGGGFPTMVINDKDSIIGFNEEKIRERFEKK